MSAQRELTDFTQPSTGDEESDDLAAIFLGIAGTHTVTEEQAETPSHEPMEGSEHEAPDLTEDGLEDAAASDVSGVTSR